MFIPVVIMNVEMTIVIGIFPVHFTSTVKWRWEEAPCSLIITAFSIVYTDWAGNKEDEEELSVWEDNWDDDNVEDDFNQQLRAQLEKQKPT